MPASSPDSILIYAAGFGTRMGPLTRDMPKPLVRVGGKPLLDHALDVVDRAGIPRKVVNTHYLGEQIADHLAGREDIRISHEMPEILETGGGLRHALPLLGPDPVFTLNTDAIWTGSNPLGQLLSAWDPTRMDALLLLVPRARATGYRGKGDFILSPDGRIGRGPGEVYTGAQIIRTDLLKTIPETSFSVNKLWDLTLAAGRTYGTLHDGGWCDVGRPEGIETAEAMLTEGGLV
ncbi:nucleotidyltransferase [Brevirhabdus pacifica]|uniref:Nucleotidyltransferase n=1 Tax=Brevirhabdus pacifica TaxID=1267768 RepID=A0A1U7DIJ5_9RHOB|nr:nucleotidyltransferase family protein [Brevirhabdus pacifica]APX89812.1 nucleotidyltransferase [Brevirhabdus pacifica]OWU74462.1 nucleotidyltransferase [Loktanella sp. 22II-4b]PJJ82978.1 MurNAc alpha-1-phosphate uridylyltransferase [Brevirhabdus pacifica]